MYVVDVRLHEQSGDSSSRVHIADRTMILYNGSLNFLGYLHVFKSNSNNSKRKKLGKSTEL